MTHAFNRKRIHLKRGGYTACIICCSLLLPFGSRANPSESPDSASTEDETAVIAESKAQNAESVSMRHRPGTLHGGNYIARLGDFDPRPYARTHLGDKLFLGTEHFRAKNRRWLEKGLAIGGYYSPNFQAGNRGGGGHAISEFLVTGAWEPVRKNDQRGRLLFGFAHDQTISSLLTREFADNQGLVETPNDLDTSPDRTFTTLGLLAWDHAYWTDENAGWGYRAGQLFAAGFFGLTGYLDDDRQYFLARPLAAAAGAQWVGANDIGLGAQLVGWRQGYYATAAIIDGSADRKFPDFDSLGDGRFLYVAETGIERDIGGPQEFTVRLTVTHLDATVDDGEAKPAGESVILSLARKFHDRWVFAARWSKSYTRLTSDYRELVSLGLIHLSPAELDGDSLGIGVFAGKPSDATRGTEYGAEVFYKLRLTQDISIMPDIQYWYRNDSSVSAARSVVFGVRVNFAY